MPAEKIPLAEPCLSCDMKCCAHFAIPLSSADVKRICAATKLPAEKFCRLVDSAQVEQPQHANVFIFDEKGKLCEKTLVLAKGKNDGGADGMNEACIFFRAKTGCFIHGAHPLACRAYPFVFEGDGSGRIKCNKHFICPRKWHAGEWNEKEVKEILDGIEVEVGEHDKFVREWNAKRARKIRGKKAEREFLGFISTTRLLPE